MELVQGDLNLKVLVEVELVQQVVQITQELLRQELEVQVLIAPDVLYFILSADPGS